MAPLSWLALRSSAVRAGRAVASSVPVSPTPNPRSLSDVTRPASSQATPSQEEQTGVARVQLDSAAGWPRLAFHARRAPACVGAAVTADTVAASRSRRSTTVAWRRCAYAGLAMSLTESL